MEVALFSLGLLHVVRRAARCMCMGRLPSWVPVWGGHGELPGLVSLNPLPRPCVQAQCGAESLHSPSRVSL